MEILIDIAWAFNQEVHYTIESFNKEISQYQIDIMEGDACWNPNEIIIDSPNVDIVYMAWIEKGGLEENETLLEDKDFFENEENSDDGQFQANILSSFVADNGKNFTSLELMYKLDKQMKTKDLGDHIFFEGLTKQESENGNPIYFMDCGS
jgi:hypothetical protein